MPAIICVIDANGQPGCARSHLGHSKFKRDMLKGKWKSLCQISSDPFMTLGAMGPSAFTCGLRNASFIQHSTLKITKTLPPPPPPSLFINSISKVLILLDLDLFLSLQF